MGADASSLGSGLSREHIRLSAAILTQLSLACVTLLFG